MDLVILDEDRQPNKLVQRYDSLIWTERFNTVGDFQITTGDIGRFMELLPEGTFLSLRDSNHTMVVETHQIDRKKRQTQKLYIKGRSVESFLDRRQALPSLTPGAEDWTVAVKTPSDLAYFIVNKICVEGILDLADIFEPDIIQFPTPTDYLTSTGPTKNFTVAKGNLLTKVLELIQAEAREDVSTTPDTPAIVPHGIRAVRPNSAGTAISIEFYKGVDRSATIRFDGSRNLLDDGSYLFSKLGSADTAYILGKNSAAKLNKSTTEVTGINRRVTLVDATASDLDAEGLQLHGEMALSAARETAIFDGSINQDLSPYTYGVDYNLGDVVKLVGDYGLVENARVTEFIRTQDTTGEKAYPTLSTIDI